MLASVMFCDCETLGLSENGNEAGVKNVSGIRGPAPEASYPSFGTFERFLNQGWKLRY